MPLPARAGAWIAPEGGQEIWTNTAGQREGLQVYETSVYWEAPLGPKTSLVAAPWVEQNYDTLEGWRGEAVVGFKRAVRHGERTVWALQAGALWQSHPDAACGEGGAEFRLLGGASSESGRRFLNVEAAERVLEGGCLAHRVDVTAGYRPHQRWLALGQVFAEAPSDGDDTIRAQLSLVRFGDSGRGIQLGVRARIDGAVDETVFVLGLWGRPGDN